MEYTSTSNSDININRVREIHLSLAGHFKPVDSSSPDIWLILTTALRRTFFKIGRTCPAGPANFAYSDINRQKRKLHSRWHTYWLEMTISVVQCILFQWFQQLLLLCTDTCPSTRAEHVGSSTLHPAVKNLAIKKQVQYYNWVMGEVNEI